MLKRNDVSLTDIIEPSQCFWRSYMASILDIAPKVAKGIFRV